MKIEKNLKNFLSNVFALILPLLVAFCAIPEIIKILGVERFGVLTLIWGVIGYLGVLDLGMSKSVTLLMSQVGRQEKEKLNQIFWTAALVLGCIGAMFTLVALIVSVVFFIDIEVRWTIAILSLGIPVIMISNALKGALESFEYFVYLNKIRAPLGMYNYLVPLVIGGYVANSLVVVTIFLVLGRILASVYYFKGVDKLVCKISKVPEFKKCYFDQLVRFGSWLTVSNVVGPLMLYIDRYAIAIFLGASAVAYYSTPYEMASKLWVLSTALTSILFPIMIRTHFVFRSEVLKNLLMLGFLMVVVILPFSLVIYIYSSEVLTIWIDEDFSNNSFFFLRVFVVGVLVNSVTQIPYTYLQSKGDSKTTAIIHVAQFPVLLILLTILIPRLGLDGAVYAWLARIVMDFFLMWGFAIRRTKSLA